MLLVNAQLTKNFKKSIAAVGTETVKYVWYIFDYSLVSRPSLGLGREGWDRKMSLVMIDQCYHDVSG